MVEKVGEGVSSVAPGDHVVTLFSPQCRECVHCVDPRTNLCMAIRAEQNLGHLPDGTVRLSRDGEDIRHFMGCSTFAEYTVMPEIALAKVNPEAPFEHIALFACGLSTGLGAAINTAKVEAGTTCVVFGAGMVGLGAVAGCRLQGAERIICVDMSEDRLELAKGQGATDTMHRRPRRGAEILAMTDGEYGADYTFEATGLVAVMQQALEATRMAWGLCTVAGVAGKGETLDVVPRLLITGRRLAGSSFGGVKGRDQVPELVDRALAGEIDVTPFISHKITPRRSEPRLRADGGPGRHPQRDRVQLGVRRRPLEIPCPPMADGYDRHYVAACRESVGAAVEELRRVGAGSAAWNQLLPALDRWFELRNPKVEGRDGNPLNEVRVLAAVGDRARLGGGDPARDQARPGHLGAGLRGGRGNQPRRRRLRTTLRRLPRRSRSEVH